MKFSRRQCLHLAVGAAAVSVVFGVLFSSDSAWSQARTIKLVVPYPPGGAVDVVARLLAEKIGKASGSTMVVEDRPGAVSVIGTEAASRAAPNGNTLLIASSAFVVVPHLRKLNYDPLTSFEPICSLVSSPAVIAVNNASPFRTLADLLSAARISSGRLTMAGVGPGTAFQIAIEMLKRNANVDMTFVPFPGSPPAVNALLGEHVTSTISDYAVVAEQIKAGGLRALATASSERIEPLPDLPTVAESGYRDYAVDVSFGLFAPAKTPKETIAQLTGLFIAALQAPETKRKLVAQGLFPIGKCGAEFGALVRKQYDEYGRVIREANIKAE
jgi:tripartite-type tricarboxylate transporter receptor subunit TctC